MGKKCLKQLSKTKRKSRSWNKCCKRLKMACWNPWGICNERVNYCKALEFDILGLTELHNVQNKSAWRGKHWITSADAELDDDGVNIDPASGVAILLGPSFANRILAQGFVGSRIVWVRLDGPVCPLFVVCVYIPHKYRHASPTAEDVIAQLEGLLSNCKPTDCTIVMGDFNCELQRNVPGCTGKWLMNKKPDNGHSSRVLTCMRSHDLFAVDSMFMPKRRKMFAGGKKKRVCNATYLQKDVQLRPKKLDYFLVSNRWKSCVRSSSTCWAPAVHRFGKAFDHSLLRMSWTWRVKKAKMAVQRDFKAMSKDAWQTLGKEIEQNLSTHAPLKHLPDNNDHIDERLRRMNSCVQKAIEKCVPTKKRLQDIKRNTSEATRKLYEVRTAKFSAIVAQGGKVSPKMRKRWNRKIRDANLADYNDWLRQMATEMEEADKKGDSETIFRIVRIISGLMSASSSAAPSVDKNGELILDQDKLASTWRQFLEGKFKATEAEFARDEYEELGPQLVADPLTEQAFVRALKKLKKGKACGPDCIPGEVYYNCESAARELYELLRLIWEREYVPAALVRASFIMLFKGKGSVNDPSKYRCIGLLPHAYKILSLVMLERISKECADFLSDWQAGFRPERGCRDNVLLLRVLFDHVLKQGENLSVTFIDYSAAFDSVSHKFLDRSLKNAGASRKTRAIFRAIYAAAEGTARVRGLNGNQVYSASFKVRRGVIQGDIISPIFFILAIEQIFRVHDNCPTGVKMGNYLHVGVLGYADDVAIVSHASEADASVELTTRLQKIDEGSRKDADMTINADKTKNMHVAKQGKLAPPQISDIKATEETFKHQCTFCPRRFKTARGMKIHMASCDCQHGLSDKSFVVKRINSVFGTVQQRWFRVEWADHPGEDKWEPERSLIKQGCESAIKEFWRQSKYNPSDEFIADPDDVWRCYKCGSGHDSEQGLKIHIARTHSKRQWRGSTADKVTRTNMRKAAQNAKPHVQLGDEEIDNVWIFKYLGSRFQADGSHLTDIKARIAAAQTTAGKMRNIWASKSTPLRLKLRIYKVGVCSKLTYGCEAWELDDSACRLLNGANSRMLSHITGRSAHEEASDKTRTFDVLAAIRARRMKWVGHILRMSPERLVHKALRHMHSTRPAPAKRHDIATRNNEYVTYSRGDLLMDVPANVTWDELIKFAANRHRWRKHVQSITGDPDIEIKFSGKGGKVSSNLLQMFPATTATKVAESAAEAQARRYRNRDAHEVFFRPGGTRKRRPTIRKKTKPKPLTDKQRAAAARAEWARYQNNMRNNSDNTATSSSPQWAAAAPRPDSDSSTGADTDIWAAPAMIPTPPPSPTSSETSVTVSLWNSPPLIHGHHRQHDDMTTQPDLTLSLDSPATFEEEDNSV